MELYNNKNHKTKILLKLKDNKYPIIFEKVINIKLIDSFLIIKEPQNVFCYNTDVIENFNFRDFNKGEK